MTVQPSGTGYRKRPRTPLISEGHIGLAFGGRPFKGGFLDLKGEPRALNNGARLHIQLADPSHWQLLSRYFDAVVVDLDPIWRESDKWQA
jgi:hypothetical protein